MIGAHWRASGNSRRKRTAHLHPQLTPVSSRIPSSRKQPLSDDLQEQLQTSLGAAYTLERELGGGGMSRVFVARETALNRQVAIEVLPEAMAGHVSIDRFRREIALAAQLQHPHIVPLLTAGEVGGLPYFTMPFVRGETLRARLSARGELPVNEAVRVLREVASALASAHDHGVVHRDIKPDNVLLSGGAAMVTDFGVAKAVSASTLGSDSGLTAMGEALATPAYMSPEQASADPLTDARSDIYAWGILAYEMLTGATPFTGRPSFAMLAAHVTETPEAISRRRPGIPPPLATLIMRCLEKRPSDRPQRAQELVETLDSMVTPAGGTERTTAQDATMPSSGSSGTMRRPAWPRVAIPIVAIVAIGALIVTVGTRVWSKRSSQTAGGTAAAPSVAVMPFVNVGGDTTNAYFADGLTDDLASALSRTGKLRVAARSSAYSFKGKNALPADVGTQLHVGAIVEGSVQRVNGRVKVIASLVSVTDGITLWTNAYERDAKDVFAVQAELSQAIAGAMRVTVLQGTRRQHRQELRAWKHTISCCVDAISMIAIRNCRCARPSTCFGRRSHSIRSMRTRGPALPTRGDGSPMISSRRTCAMRSITRWRSIPRPRRLLPCAGSSRPSPNGSTTPHCNRWNSRCCATPRMDSWVCTSGRSCWRRRTMTARLLQSGERSGSTRSREPRWPTR
ncbi:hypothetical protein BH11GEM2_BH11GEM2_06810 [soil metagenome]